MSIYSVVMHKRPTQHVYAGSATLALSAVLRVMIANGDSITREIVTTKLVDVDDVLNIDAYCND